MTKLRPSQLQQEGATNGQALVWNNTLGLWVPGTVSGGGSLTVQDENGGVGTGISQIDFQGAGVTATLGTGEVIVTIPGGGGGSGMESISWTKILNADPMPVGFSGWTTRTGVWTGGTSFGVQTSTNVTDDFLEYTTAGIVSPNVRAIQATIRAPSSGKAGFSFGNGGVVGTNDLDVGIDVASNNVWYDVFGNGGSTFVNPTGTAFAINTDYTFMVMELASNTFWVFVNGIFAGRISPTLAINKGTIGLYTRSPASVVSWRAVTIWSGVPSFVVPT